MGENWNVDFESEPLQVMSDANAKNVNISSDHLRLPNIRSENKTNLVTKPVARFAERVLR